MEQMIFKLLEQKKMNLPSWQKKKKKNTTQQSHKGGEKIRQTKLNKAKRK